MVSFRKARRSDLLAIVELLADDALGQAREVVSDPIDPRYEQAWQRSRLTETSFWQSR